MPLNTSIDNYVPPEVALDSEIGKTVGNTRANLPVGWYTIAVNAGNRATGRFVLTDQSSDAHQVVSFEVSHHYGNGNNFSLLHQSCYNNTPIRLLRLKFGGIYDGVLLQAYLEQSINAVRVVLTNNEQLGGWTLKDWVPDGINPGGLNNFSACTKTTLIIDLHYAGKGGNLMGVIGGNSNYAFLRQDGWIQCSYRMISGGPGTGGVWVDGGSKQFFGSLDSTLMGIYNNGWHFLFDEAGSFFLRNPTQNQILWNSSGTGSPTNVIRSPGTKLCLSPEVGMGTSDYALGIEPSALWLSVPKKQNQFKFYEGTFCPFSVGGTNSKVTIDAGTDVMLSLRVIGQSGSAHTSFESYCDANTPIILESVKATGTSINPQNSGTGAWLAEWRASGYNGSNQKKNSTSIACLVDGSPSSTAGIPGRIELRTSDSSGMVKTVVAAKSNGAFNFAPLASAPSSPSQGDAYYDSSLKKLRVFDGTVWQNCW